MSLLYCEGATISNLSQIIMSPSREQCEWCNHGNTATETREGTERMLPEQICTHILKKTEITLNQRNEQQDWDKFILCETSLERTHTACVNLQYSTCRDEEDNVSVSSSSLPLLLYSSLCSSELL